MINKKFILLFLCIFKIVWSQLQNSQDEVKMMKKTKVLACIAISKARMVQDAKSFNDLVESINTYLKIQDGRSKVLSLCLVNCFNKVTTEKAFEIITQMHGQGEIDSLTEENKNLLGLSESSFSEMQNDNFVKDFQEVNAILKELNQENESLKKSTPEKNAEKPKQEQKKSSTSQQREKKQPEEEYFIMRILTRYFEFWKSFLLNLLNLLRFEGYLGYGILIVFAFLALTILKNLCQPKKKKNKNKTPVTNIEEEVNTQFPSQTMDLLKED